VSSPFGLRLQELRDQVWSSHSQITRNTKLSGQLVQRLRLASIQVSDRQSGLSALNFALLLPTPLLTVELFRSLSRLLVVPIPILVAVAALILHLAIRIGLAVYRLIGLRALAGVRMLAGVWALT
jgi:hypothetical protein